jgi:galactokinase/mevalonate kinase-like predicted kinase
VTIRAPFASASPGGGTDVGPFPETEGGAVLSATIDRYTYGSSSARTDDRIRIESIDLACSRDFAADQSTLDLAGAKAEDDLLTTAEVMAITHAPASTVRYCHVGTGPLSFRLGRRVVYRRRDVLAWIARCDIQEHQSAS